jgi:methylated-DNA-[protein]-cysteine S-methyltransferase
MINIWFAELSDTPIGPLGFAATQQGLARLSLYGLEKLRNEVIFRRFPQNEILPVQENPPAHLAAALDQVDEYLQGRRQVFDLPLDLQGFTPLTLQIMAACKAIPFGRKKTYLQLAIEVQRPRSARFVGNTMARNPIPLIVPCHRVVGSDGRLHGFGAPGGLATKTWLLDMEGHFAAG